MLFAFILFFFAALYYSASETIVLKKKLSLEILLKVVAIQYENGLCFHCHFDASGAKKLEKKKSLDSHDKLTD